MLKLAMNSRVIGIGALEARVLRALYEQAGWVRVGTVRKRLTRDTPIDRSSVMTCLRRMADKGYLKARKDKEGAWTFRPTLSRHKLAFTIIQTICESLWASPPAALSRFVTNALTGKLGEEGVPEELKEIARRTEDLRQLGADLSSPGLAAEVGGGGPVNAAPTLRRDRVLFMRIPARGNLPKAGPGSAQGFRTFGRFAPP